MDTRPPDEMIDERLGAAGARLRSTAPGSEATEAALAEVRGEPGALRRMWWVLPTGLVAAAAATIGVLVIADRPDRADEQVPAVTPPVTPAPTTSPPVVVDDFPPIYSAAVLGCPGTVGDVLAAAPGLDPVNGLTCSGDEALILSGDIVVSLRRGADGTWSELARESSDCRPADCAVPFDVLPFPPESLLVRDLGDLPPVDVTPQVDAEAAQIQVSELTRWVHALGSRLAVGQDPEPVVTREFVDGADVVLITLSGLGDDSIGEVTYVVWYDPSPPVPRVERAFLISRCSRGVAVDEAGEPLDLCL